MSLLAVTIAAKAGVVCELTEIQRGDIAIATHDNYYCRTMLSPSLSLAGLCMTCSRLCLVYSLH